MFIHSKDITFLNFNFVTKNNFRGIRMGIGPIWEINSLNPSSFLAYLFKENFVMYATESCSHVIRRDNFNKG